MPDQLDDAPVVEKSFSFNGYTTNPPQLYLGAEKSAAANNVDLRHVLIRRKRPGVTVELANTTNSAPGGYGQSTVPGILFRTSKNQFVSQLGSVMYMLQSGASINLGSQGGTNPQTLQLIEAAGSVIRLGVTGTVPALTVAVASVWDMNSANDFADVVGGNTTFPSSRCAAWTSQGRMFASDTSLDATQLDFIYYSNSQDPLTWDKTVQVLRIGRSDGIAVNAILETSQNIVLIIKLSKIYELDISNPNPSFWNARLIMDGYGVSAPCNCLIYQGRPYLLCEDGLYDYGMLKSGNTVPLSFEIQQDFDSFVNRNLTSSGRSSVVTRHAGVTLSGWSGMIFLSHPNLSYALVYHIATKRWSKFTPSGTRYICGMATGFPANTATANTDPYFHAQGLWGLLYNATDAPSVLGLYDDSDVGGSEGVITYQEETGGLSFGQIENRKNGDMLEVYYLANASAGSLVVDYQIDESQSWTTLATINLTKQSDGVTAATANSLNVYRIPLSGLAQFYEIRFRFTDSANAISRIVGWACFAKINNLELS